MCLTDFLRDIFSDANHSFTQQVCLLCFVNLLPCAKFSQSYEIIVVITVPFTCNLSQVPDTDKYLNTMRGDLSFSCYQ